MRVTPAVLTLAYLIPASIWWFTQLSLMPTSTGQLSLQALEALLLTQVLFLCLFVPLWTRPTADIKQGATAIAAALLPSWPLLAMLSLASGVTVLAMVASQTVLAVVGLIITSIAMILQRATGAAEPMRLVRVSVGLIAASVALMTRAIWLPWVTS
jgi:hypothetical protein